MSIEIREVKSKKDHKLFIEVPYLILGKDPMFVPPLRAQVEEILSPKHPFYEIGEMKRWIAFKDDKLAGRIAAIVNNYHIKFHDERSGHFGFFDSINDQGTAHGLISEAIKYLKDSGMENMRGPFEPSTNYQCGMLVEGHDDPPQIMMTYAPKYYQTLLENEGFAKIKDLLAYKLPIDTPLPPKLIEISEKTKSHNGITCRPFCKKDWDNEVKRFKDIYNHAWEKNWGFIPFTEKEFDQLAKELKPLLEEKLALIIEVRGKAAGIILAIPDYNQIIKTIKNGRLLPTGIFKLLFNKKKINRARIILLGVKKEFRNLGLSTLFFIEIQKSLKEIQQYKEVEMSWILEDNEPMNAPLKMINAKVYKKYRILEKKI